MARNFAPQMGGTREFVPGHQFIPDVMDGGYDDQESMMQVDMFSGVWWWCVISVNEHSSCCSVCPTTHTSSRLTCNCVYAPLQTRAGDT